MHGTLRLVSVFISPLVWNMCEHLHYESVYISGQIKLSALHWSNLIKNHFDWKYETLSGLVCLCFTANDIMQYLYYSNILSNIEVDFLVIPVIK